MRKLFVIPALFLVASALGANAPQIHNLAAVASGPHVSVRFTLVNAFADRDLVKALQSGLPTRFEYVVEIYRDRPWWIDHGVGRSRIEVTATFDSITREYVLSYKRDKLLVRSETFTDLDSLERRMTSIDEPSLFDIGARRAYKLHVRARADFGRTFLFYVIPSSNSTDWRDVRVSVPEAKP